MFNFGESGYHEYRATQSGPTANKTGLGAYVVLVFMGAPIGLFVAAIIGCFLYYSWSG
jgi:hypothetical protein